MNHRTWTMEICNRTPIGELRNEHSALYGEWKSASLEVERLAKVNGDLCDKITELQQPIRVPFSDAQIEKMAKAARFRFNKSDVDNWDCAPQHSRDSWVGIIRAALAAGSLEPCAVPEYKPEDVAFSSRVPELEAKIENQRMNLRQLHEARERDALERARLESELTALKVRVTAERDAALAECKHLNAIIADLRQPVDADVWKTDIDVPKGVPSVEELAKIWNAASEFRSAIAAIRDAVLAGVAQDRESLVNALIEAKQQRDVLASKLLAQGVSVRDLYSEGDSKPFGGWHFEDGKIVPNGEQLENIEELPTPATPTDAEVEALARVLEAAYPGHKTDYENMSESFKQARRAQARAAFAHIGARQGEKATRYEHERGANAGLVAERDTVIAKLLAQFGEIVCDPSCGIAWTCTRCQAHNRALEIAEGD